MRRRNIARSATGTSGRLPGTGEHCPTSGWWIAPGSDRPRFIAEGDLMPSMDGRPVTCSANQPHRSSKSKPMPAPTLIDEKPLNAFPDESLAIPSTRECDEDCRFCSLPETD